MSLDVDSPCQHPPSQNSKKIVAQKAVPYGPLKAVSSLTLTGQSLRLQTQLRLTPITGFENGRLPAWSDACHLPPRCPKLPKTTHGYLCAGFDPKLEIWGKFGLFRVVSGNISAVWDPISSKIPLVPVN